MSEENKHNDVNEGVIKVDLKRMMTKIMGAIEFKTNPKMRQELLAAIKDDVESILKKYDYMTFESDVNEGADYKYKKSSKYPVKATVCYIDKARGKRICKDLYFKSRFDAEGFRDNVVGFPKGAEVEAINEEGSSKIKTFEQYIEEMSTPANTPGMGSVLFPGDPGLSGNFSSQAHGSGDIPLEIYKKKKKKKAKK